MLTVGTALVSVVAELPLSDACCAACQYMIDIGNGVVHSV